MSQAARLESLSPKSNLRSAYYGDMDTIQQLLIGAIEDISEVGASRFSPVTLCARLKIQPSLVNYHFGSKMGLILDASVLAYEQYVEGQALALEAPTRESRLESWIESQIDWTIKHAGIASVLNFPGLTGPANIEFSREHQARLASAATLNMQVLSTIVGQFQDVEQSDQLMSATKLADYPRVALSTAMIGWLVLGHSVWRSGNHLPTSELPPVLEFQKRVFAAVVPTAIEIAKGLTLQQPTSESHAQGR